MISLPIQTVFSSVAQFPGIVCESYAVQMMKTFSVPETVTEHAEYHTTAAELQVGMLCKT